MENKNALIGAAIIGQSGGPSSVINASAYGVIKTALESESITAVYGANHGIMGVLEDRLMDMSKEEYHNHQSTTINHFYEKLFLLTSMMNTPTAKEIALAREQYMKDYIDEFMSEWDGKK